VGLGSFLPKDPYVVLSIMSLDAQLYGEKFAKIDNGGGAVMVQNGRWISVSSYHEYLKVKSERKWEEMTRWERLSWWLTRPFAYVIDTTSAAENMGRIGNIPGTRIWIDGTYYGFDGKKY